MEVSRIKSRKRGCGREDSPAPSDSALPGACSPDQVLASNMKIPPAIIALLSMGVFLSGCQIAGPAYPEKNGRTYLEKRGYPDDLISRLADGGKLSASEVRELQASGSPDVRFLVARNPSLTPGQLAVSIADKDDFTRSGVARNANLSPSQIARLTHDESHTVYAALAGNPALSDAELLRIREERHLADLWFAMNPNCPASIRRSILASDDSSAKHWLKIVDGWKKDGRYVRDPKGRWREA